MPIAQMNYGRMKFAPDDDRIADFMENLERVYGLAESHPGFIWRLPDDAVAEQLASLGYDDRTSATVSTWESVDDMKDFTFKSEHGTFFDQRANWFETLEGPQLVIWEVDRDARPTFAEAFVRLDKLRTNGPSEDAFGW